MPDADELEGSRLLALLAFEELSQYGPSPSSVPIADLPPLLRCCFRSLHLLDQADPDLATRCSGRLRDFIHSALSHDPDPSFGPALEVLFEKLVDGNQLRSYTMIDDDAMQKGSMISTIAQSCQHELRVRLELMAHHFISSLQDEGQFWGALDWSEKVTQRIPELHLAVAMSLVRRSYEFSMPVIAQAHFVLLASRCPANGDRDLHLQVFQHTMSAYLIYLPALGVFDRSNAVETPRSVATPTRDFLTPVFQAQLIRN